MKIKQYFFQERQRSDCANRHLQPRGLPWRDSEVYIQRSGVALEPCSTATRDKLGDPSLLAICAHQIVIHADHVPQQLASLAFVSAAADATPD